MTDNTNQVQPPQNPYFLLEQREEYKEVIRRIIAMNPSMSIRSLHNRLKTAEKPIEMDRATLTKIVREIREDRVREIQEETKEDMYAAIADIVEFVNNQLRAIAQEEKLVYTKNKDGVPTEKAETRIFAQHNRIKALNSVVDNTIKLVNLKMDLGIVERKLGTADVRIIDAMAVLKKIRNGDYTTPLEQLIDAPAVQPAAAA